MEGVGSVPLPDQELQGNPSAESETESAGSSARSPLHARRRKQQVREVCITTPALSERFQPCHSQRTCPRMVLIVPSLDLDQSTITVNAPNMPPLTFSLESYASAEIVNVSVWDDSCEAEVLPLQVSQWFQRFLDREDYRIVRFSDTFTRRTDSKYTPNGISTLFSDGFPLLVASEESLEAVNSILKSEVSMENFRWMT